MNDNEALKKALAIYGKDAVICFGVYPFKMVAVTRPQRGQALLEVKGYGDTWEQVFP